MKVMVGFTCYKQSAQIQAAFSSHIQSRGYDDDIDNRKNPGCAYCNTCLFPLPLCSQTDGDSHRHVCQQHRSSKCHQHGEYDYCVSVSFLSVVMGLKLNA